MNANQVGRWVPWLWAIIALLAVDELYKALWGVGASRTLSPRLLDACAQLLFASTTILFWRLKQKLMPMLALAMVVALFIWAIAIESGP